MTNHELQKRDEVATGEANTYVVRPIRTTQYKLQKLYLVATYEDKQSQEWHMIMPSELTKALSTSLNFYLDMANKGVKAPSAKQLRMMSSLGQFFGGKELWWHTSHFLYSIFISIIMLIGVTASYIVGMQYWLYSNIDEELVWISKLVIMITKQELLDKIEKANSNDE